MLGDPRRWLSSFVKNEVSLVESQGTVIFIFSLKVSAKIKWSAKNKASLYKMLVLCEKCLNVWEDFVITTYLIFPL